MFHGFTSSNNVCVDTDYLKCLVNTNKNLEKANQFIKQESVRVGEANQKLVQENDGLRVSRQIAWDLQRNQKTLIEKLEREVASLKNNSLDYIADRKIAFSRREGIFCSTVKGTVEELQRSWDECYEKESEISALKSKLNYVSKWYKS